MTTKIVIFMTPGKGVPALERGYTRVTRVTLDYLYTTDKHHIICFSIK